MFCKNCGKEIEDSCKHCPNCGTALANMVVNTPSKDPKRKGKKKVVFIVLGVFVVFALFLALSGGADDGADYLKLVQEGYLGNYDTVTVKEVLESCAADGNWGDGESKSGGSYVVEYAAELLKVQFKITEDGQAFEVSGMEFLDENVSEAAEIKTFLDSFYDEYNKKYPDKGIVLDYSFHNDTLKGHKGPVKEASGNIENEWYSVDLKEYIGLTLEEIKVQLPEIQEADMQEFTELQGTTFTDKQKAVILMMLDGKTLTSITIQGNSKNSPAFMGIRIGDDKEQVSEKVPDSFEIGEETGTLDKTLKYTEVESGNSLELTYSGETQKINKIAYYGNLEMSMEETEQPETVSDNVEADYLFPDSDKVELTKDDIQDLTEDERQIIINEIYAKHGRKFNDADIQAYFNAKSWYEGIIEPEDFDAEKLFNQIEKDNIKILNGETVEASAEVNDPETEKSNEINFIGVSGNYGGGDPGTDEYTPCVTITLHSDNTLDFILGYYPNPANLWSGTATIISNNVATFSENGTILTFTWNEAGVVTITRNIETTGDSAIDNATDSEMYVNNEYLKVG